MADSTSDARSVVNSDRECSPMRPGPDDSPSKFASGAESQSPQSARDGLLSTTNQMDSVPQLITPSPQSPQTTNDLRFVCTSCTNLSRRSGGLLLLNQMFKQVTKRRPDFPASNFFAKDCTPGAEDADRVTKSLSQRCNGHLLVVRDAVFQRWVGAEE